jgi:hypothetical protein
MMKASNEQPVMYKSAQGLALVFLLLQVVT